MWLLLLIALLVEMLVGILVGKIHGRIPLPALLAPLKFGRRPMSAYEWLPSIEISVLMLMLIIGSSSKSLEILLSAVLHPASHGSCCSHAKHMHSSLRVRVAIGHSPRDSISNRR